MCEDDLHPDLSAISRRNGDHGMATIQTRILEPMKFQSILQLDVPKGRDGKHKRIVTRLLADIERLTPGTALKVPLEALPDTQGEHSAPRSTGPAPARYRRCHIERQRIPLYMEGAARILTRFLSGR